MAHKGVPSSNPAYPPSGRPAKWQEVSLEVGHGRFRDLPHAGGSAPWNRLGIRALFFVPASSFEWYGVMGVLSLLAELEKKLTLRRFAIGTSPAECTAPLPFFVILVVMQNSPDAPKQAQKCARGTKKQQETWALRAN